MSDKIKPQHLSRKAILYVRQSSAYQVSHNLESVFELADRIVVLRHGTKIADVRTAATSRNDIVSLLTSGKGLGES